MVCSHQTKFVCGSLEDTANTNAKVENEVGPPGLPHLSPRCLIARLQVPPVGYPLSLLKHALWAYELAGKGPPVPFRYQITAWGWPVHPYRRSVRR